MNRSRISVYGFADLESIDALAESTFVAPPDLDRTFLGFGAAVPSEELAFVPGF